MYLNRSTTILFQMLKKTFNCTLKTREGKDFIYQRIVAFDQYYCLEVHRQLWQSYFEIGGEKQTWPVSRSMTEMSFSHVLSFQLF